MISIAICDDDKEICLELKNTISEFSVSYKEEVSFNMFQSGEALLNYIKNNQVDILYLDIELGDESGVDIGNQIRNDLNNELTKIIYISAIETYAMALFQVRPMDFIVKPLNKKRVKESLRIALKLLGTENYFKYGKNREITSILIKNIIYFESDRKKVIIKTNTVDYEFYGKLDDVEKQLEGQLFIRTHQSYLVNYNYIVAYKSAYVTLSNNIDLPISQKRQKMIKSKLLSLNN